MFPLRFVHVLTLLFVLGFGQSPCNVSDLTDSQRDDGATSVKCPDGGSVAPLSVTCDDWEKPGHSCEGFTYCSSLGGRWGGGTFCFPKTSITNSTINLQEHSFMKEFQMSKDYHYKLEFQFKLLSEKPEKTNVFDFVMDSAQGPAMYLKPNSTTPVFQFAPFTSCEPSNIFKTSLELNRWYRIKFTSRRRTDQMRFTAYVDGEERCSKYFRTQMVEKGSVDGHVEIPSTKEPKADALVENMIYLNYGLVGWPKTCPETTFKGYGFETRCDSTDSWATRDWCTLRCNKPGYYTTASRDTRKHCNTDGTWDDSEPKCIHHSDTPPSRDEHREESDNSGKYWAAAIGFYLCFSGICCAWAFDRHYDMYSNEIVEEENPSNQAKRDHVLNDVDPVKEHISVDVDPAKKDTNDDLAPPSYCFDPSASLPPSYEEHVQCEKEGYLDTHVPESH